MAPTIRPERDFAAACGVTLVAGVDEAGRGPLAGPVVAAAVIFPCEGRRPVGLNDSKVVPAARRERLFDQIRRTALTHGVGVATAQEIDMYNVLEATRLAARRAIEQLDPPPQALVTDALILPGERRPVLPIIKGDALSASIAAASILAKVTRDRMMDHYAEEFPGYGWERNRGYGTEEHYHALQRLGPTVLHRTSFEGVTFFHETLRHSRTFALLLERLHASTGDREVLRLDIEGARDRLAPTEYDELVAALAL